MKRALVCLLLGLAAAGACDLNPQPLPPMTEPGLGDTNPSAGEDGGALSLGPGGGTSSSGGFASSGAGSSGSSSGASQAAVDGGFEDGGAGTGADASAPDAGANPNDAGITSGDSGDSSVLVDASSGDAQGDAQGDAPSDSGPEASKPNANHEDVGAGATWAGADAEPAD